MSVVGPVFHPGGQSSADRTHSLSLTVVLSPTQLHDNTHSHCDDHTTCSQRCAVSNSNKFHRYLIKSFSPLFVGHLITTFPGFLILDFLFRSREGGGDYFVNPHYFLSPGMCRTLAEDITGQ